MPQMLNDDYNPNHASSKELKWDQFAPKYKPKDGWNKIRIYGLVYTDARHDNIPTKGGKAYNEFCRGYDVENDQFYADRFDRCTCCALGFQTKIRSFVNVLDADMWERRPADMTGWNPFFLLEMSPNLHDKIVGLRTHPLNTTGANIGDPLRGALLSLKYDKKAPSPANVYDVSLLQSGWAFPEELLKIVFPQTSPEGRRYLRKAEGPLPAAWVYFPCRNTKEKMEQSLRTHGHLEAVSEAHTEVKSRAEALRADLDKFTGSAATASTPTNVAKLAQLHAEPDAAPPPPAVQQQESLDEIPF